MTLRVVTASTAYLPAAVAEAADLRVVPLTVTVSGRDGREGLEVSSADVARALRERRVAVTTSRPAPTEFATAYHELFAAGATGIVSVHLPASPAYESAELAAEEFGGRVAGRLGSVRWASASWPWPLRPSRPPGRPRRRTGCRRAGRQAHEHPVLRRYAEFLRRGGRIGPRPPARHRPGGQADPARRRRRGLLREKVRTSAWPWPASAFDRRGWETQCGHRRAAPGRGRPGPGSTTSCWPGSVPGTPVLHLRGRRRVAAHTDPA